MTSSKSKNFCSSFLPGALANMQLSGETAAGATQQDFPFLDLRYTGKTQHPPVNNLKPQTLYDKGGYVIKFSKYSGFAWLSNREEHLRPNAYKVTLAVVAKANKYNTLKYSFSLSAKDMLLIPSSQELSEKNQTVEIRSARLWGPSGGTGGNYSRNIIRVSSPPEDPDVYVFIITLGIHQHQNLASWKVIFPRHLFVCFQQSVARLVEYCKQKAVATSVKMLYQGIYETLYLRDFVCMAYAHGLLRQMFCNFLTVRCKEFLLDYDTVSEVPVEMSSFLRSAFFHKVVLSGPAETLASLQYRMSPGIQREYFRACAEKTLRECAEKADLDIHILQGVDPVARYLEIWQYMLQLTRKLRQMLWVGLEEHENTADSTSHMISIMRTVQLPDVCSCFWEEGDHFISELYAYDEYGEHPDMYVTLDWQP